MGNLCGKQSKDNFDGQGRTLGSAPAPATKASVPSNVASAPKRTVGGPPRTLGEGSSTNDPKAAAAAAAEVRIPVSLSTIKETKHRRLSRRMCACEVQAFGFSGTKAWHNCAKRHQGAVSVKPFTGCRNFQMKRVTYQYARHETVRPRPAISRRSSTHRSDRRIRRRYNKLPRRIAERETPTKRPRRGTTIEYQLALCRQRDCLVRGQARCHILAVSH